MLCEEIKCIIMKEVHSIGKVYSNEEEHSYEDAFQIKGIPWQIAFGEAYKKGHLYEIQ